MLSVLVSSAFATSNPLSPSSSLTPQTTSVDIEAFQALTNYPNNGLMVLNCGTGISCGGTRFVNFTTAFSFAPAKNFVSVSAVTVSIVFNQVQSSTGAYSSPDSFSVQVNGNSPVPLGMTVVTASAGTITSHSIPTQFLRAGTNLLNIGLASGGELRSLLRNKGYSLLELYYASHSDKKRDQSSPRKQQNTRQRITVASQP